MTSWTVAHQAPLFIGILQAGILEWGAMPSSRGLSQTRDWTQVSCIAGGFFTIWATREAREYWSGQPIPSPVDLPDPGIELGSPALQVDSLPAELPGKPSISSLQHHRWITVYSVTSCPGTTLWGVWVQWYALEEKTAWMWWSLMIFTTAWNSSQPSSPETFFFCPHLDLLSLAHLGLPRRCQW